MASKSDVATPLSQPTAERSIRTFFGLAYDFAFAAVLFGALIGSVLYLPPLMSGDSKTRPGDSVVIGALFPLGLLVLLALIERLFAPAGPRKSLQRWLLHLHISLVLFIAASVAGVLAAMASSALAHRLGTNMGWIDLRFVQGKGLIALIVATWLSAVISDFFYYWYHRVLHKTPFLWAHHKMHHMDRELDVLTNARENWLELLMGSLFMTIPMTLIFKLDQLDPWELGIVGGVTVTVVGTLLSIGHMNVRLQVGKASLFYCSPQVHRIHHSHLPQHRDKNFAFVLPLWDVIFGTYYAPMRDEFPPTGVVGEKEIESFFEALIFTPREWWKMFRAWRARRALLAH